eukprot:55065_1
MTIVCKTDEFKAAFLEFGISIPVFIILQLTLLFNTIYHEYIQRNDTKYQSISLKLRVLFIVLQLIGLFWTIVDLFGFVIDPFTLMLRDNTGCDLTAYSPQIVPILYYGIYLYQVLLRLELSFADSFLALTKRSTIVLASFILIPLTIIPILHFILNRKNTACIQLWKPMDFPHLYTQSSNTFAFCYGQLGAASTLIVVIGILWVASSNIIFGVIFSIKLHKLLSKNEGNETTKFRFKTLVLKNTIVSISGSISTIACWMLWIFMIQIDYKLGFGALFLYLDLFVNCMCIGLMFKYNEKWYKRICKCFILMCFNKCDKTRHKMSEHEVMEYVNDEINLSSIFSTQSKNDTSTQSKNDTTIQLQKVKSISDIMSDVDNNTHTDKFEEDDDNFIMAHVSTPMTPQSNIQSITV